MSRPATAVRPRWRSWRTWSSVALAVASIAVGVAVGWHFLVETSADVTVDTETWYVLVNRHSGKALEVEGRAIADGAAVLQQARDDGPWQQWQFIDAGDGHYRLRNQHTNRVLDLTDYSPDEGAAIVQWSDTEGPNQQFRIVESEAGYVRLINYVSNKALEVYDSSMADGAAVKQRTDRNRANQQWRLIAVGSADYPEPGSLEGDLGVHDPSVVHRPEGGYLLAGTGEGIGLKTSTDLVAWTDVGSAFPAETPWADLYTDDSRELWAPDLSYHGGRYLMYYSASNAGSQKSAIFLATSTTGEPGSWTHQGLVVESREGDDFNAIDPNLLVDDAGRWWLSFGSYWSGIKMVELDPASGMRLDDTVVGIASRNNGISPSPYYGRIEAPYIVKRGAHYYLYVSFDSCCAEASSDYRVMVGRSTSPTGPFVDRHGVAMMDGGGAEVLAGYGGVHGPGHQAVLADGDGDGDYLIYHYYPDGGDGPTKCGYCTLGINRIGYDADDWPYLDRGAVAS